MSKSLSKRLQLETWDRDAWHCRSCQKPVFFSPAFKVLDELAPGHSYYHRNGKVGEMLPLLQTGWACAFHVVPVTRGGPQTARNLVTACWDCVARKRPQLRSLELLAETPQRLVRLRWDGLSSVYEKLMSPADDWCQLLRERAANDGARPSPKRPTRR